MPTPADWQLGIGLVCIGLAGMYIGHGVHQIAHRFDDGRKLEVVRPVKVRLDTRKAKAAAKNSVTKAIHGVQDRLFRRTYQVVYGDTLYSIARLENVDPVRFAQANGLDLNENIVLLPGQMLKLPK